MSGRVVVISMELIVVGEASRWPARAAAVPVGGYPTANQRGRSKTTHL